MALERSSDTQAEPPSAESSSQMRGLSHDFPDTIPSDPGRDLRNPLTTPVTRHTHTQTVLEMPIPTHQPLQREANYAPNLESSGYVSFIRQMRYYP